MLAACLTYFAYHQRDGVGLLTFDTEVRAIFRRAAAPASCSRCCTRSTRPCPAKGTEFKKPLDFLAEILNRRGLIILISDFYDEPANILAGLKALKAKGNDIMVFHIMDDFELTFPFEEMAQFEDLETTEKTARHSGVSAHAVSERHRAITSRRCRKGLKAAQIDYTLMNTSKPLDSGLFSYLAARAHNDMNFLNPFFLIGSVVLAIPVLIHLVRRERSEIVPFSSLMFLLKIPKRMIRQQKLKNLLLMASAPAADRAAGRRFCAAVLVQSATPDAATGRAGSRVRAAAG